MDGALLRARLDLLPDRPVPGLRAARRAEADAVTFFVGSILFTAGGALQSWHRVPRTPFAACRAGRRGGPRSIQSAGTLFFNVTTYQALHTALSNPDYDRLVWRPGRVRLDLLPGLGRDRLPRLGAARLAARARPRGWWEPAINLLGCIFFGISAIAGYVVPSTGSMLDLAAANWNTALGAACFLACALATLLTGRTLKSPRLRRIHKLEQDPATGRLTYVRR